jgi:hypothetical protein
MINLLYYNQKQKKINNLINDFNSTTISHPNISELWLNSLRNNQLDESIIRQGQKIIKQIKNNEINDLTKLNILFILGFASPLIYIKD